jgi:hypothetical protein
MLQPTRIGFLMSNRLPTSLSSQMEAAACGSAQAAAFFSTKACSAKRKKEACVLFY